MTDTGPTQPRLGEGLHPSAFAASLPLALFLAGLAGGALHCAGMCGPFVLGQVMVCAAVLPAVNFNSEPSMSSVSSFMPSLISSTRTSILKPGCLPPARK